MKEYPAFIIDRSRRSKASQYTDDFIVCTDNEVGFIARVFRIPKSRRVEFSQTWLASPEKFIVKVIGEAVVVLEIVKFLHEPVVHFNRVQPLMKKALKAYLHGEQKAVEGDGSVFDLQISAVEDVLRMIESQYDRLVDINGESATRLFVNSITSAAESLRLLKKIIKAE